jgi:predicted phosphoribosyltransferase/dienelactone hydrolase
MLHSTGDIVIPIGDKQLGASWTLPKAAQGIIVFAHGSGSSRHSPRNQEVARALQQARFATLLMDLLEEGEANDRANVFDIGLLAGRVVRALDWLAAQPALARLPIGLFGASTGAAAALRAAAQRPGIVKAVVSRGGRPDLAWHDLPRVKAPTLLIVGGEDFEVLQLNRTALRRMRITRDLQIIPGATHLFEEPGALQKVALLARQWFRKCLMQDPDDDEHPIGFANRAEAALRLAEHLKERTLTDPLILGIPRGGIVLGAILADELNAELDVVLARKLRMPGNPEFALGAIAENGERYLNIPLKEMTPPLQTYLEEECQRQLEEIARRRELFRHGRPAASMAGRSVIVTDDGIATGSTMIAALRAVRGQNPQELIVGVPVASPDRLREVQKECDETVCLIEAPHLFAVGQFYQDFTQVDDEEVVSLLSRFAQ